MGELGLAVSVSLRSQSEHCCCCMACQEMKAWAAAFRGNTYGEIAQTDGFTGNFGAEKRAIPE